jgi:hypothetical protein
VTDLTPLRPEPISSTPYDPHANPYYSPAAVGLKILFEEDDRNACYSFDQVVVFGSLASGAVYMATDSGCSCPSPFEDYAGPDGLAKMVRLDPTRREHLTETIRTEVDRIDDRPEHEVTEAVQKALAAIDSFVAEATR